MNQQAIHHMCALFAIENQKSRACFYCHFVDSMYTFHISDELHLLFINWFGPYSRSTVLNYTASSAFLKHMLYNQPVDSL